MPTRSPDWNQTFDILRDIMIANRLYMDSAEREIMFFIYARTQAFGKAWEGISYRHFMEGVYRTSDGAVIMPPLPMSKTTLVNGIHHLVSKGLLERRGSLTGSTEYRIREEHEADKQHLEAYVRRHQPKLFAYVCKARETGVRQAARVRPGRVPHEERGFEGLTLVPTDTKGWYPGVPRGGTHEYQYNSTNNNSTKDNTAVRSAPSTSLRKISLRKRV